VDRALSSPKKIVIIAGPNGAGKTTFAREFLPKEAGCPDFINVDLIAAGLSPFAPEKAAILAGRLMLQEIRRRTQQGESFAFETTLSGRGYARLIPKWRAAGYRVKLIFLGLSSADLAIDRVAARVAQGGHAVPEDIVRRRFNSGLQNLRNVYAPIVDAWVLYDNSEAKPKWLDTGANPR
jgi:predicted ABC-type ATPase